MISITSPSLKLNSSVSWASYANKQRHSGSCSFGLIVGFGFGRPTPGAGRLLLSTLFRCALPRKHFTIGYIVLRLNLTNLAIKLPKNDEQYFYKFYHKLFMPQNKVMKRETCHLVFHFIWGMHIFTKLKQLSSSIDKIWKRIWKPLSALIHN